jgi:thioredoxin 1
MVKVISDLSEIPKDKKVVIDFFAHWCGPCKRIAPEYEEFSKKYTNVEFLKVDIDESNELAEAFGIESLPTFIFIENGNILKGKEILGADMETLKNSLEEMNQIIISTPPLGAIPSLPESPKD